MSQAKELDWNRMFACALPTPKKTVTAKCTCGNGNRRTAKRILCTCKCHSTHHGEENRRGMEPLDKTLGLDKTGTETLAQKPIKVEGENKWLTLIQNARKSKLG